jgi:hypothetical protein
VVFKCCQVSVASLSGESWCIIARDIAIHPVEISGPPSSVQSVPGARLLPNFNPGSDGPRAWSSLTRWPEAAHATTVTFSFSAADVPLFQCQLDDHKPAACSSPYTLARLPAGSGESSA